MKLEDIDLDKIDLDGSPEVRENTRQETVEEYAELYRTNQLDTAPDLFAIPRTKFYLVADGMHRIKAAKLAGMTHLFCNVHEGSLIDCFRFAANANSQHGLRRTNGDKRKTVETALVLYKGASSNSIAEVCGVSAPFVNKVRADQEADGVIPKAEVRTTASGNNMNVSRIGVKEAKEESLTYKPFQVAPIANQPLTILPKPKVAVNEIVEDKIGREIPPAALVYWNRQDEIKQFLSEIMVIRKRVAQIIESKDVLWARCMLSDAEAAADRLYSEIEGALAYAVCPTCQGHTIQKPKSTCEFCRGKGLLSKLLWDATVDRETKTMVAASVQRRKESAA